MLRPAPTRLSDGMTLRPKARGSRSEHGVPIGRLLRDSPIGRPIRRLSIALTSAGYVGGDFLRRAEGHERPVEQQVVRDLQCAGDEERQVDPIRAPTNNGLIAAPSVRATPVMPAAAARSSGATTAIT